MSRAAQMSVSYNVIASASYLTHKRLKHQITINQLMVHDFDLGALLPEASCVALISGGTALNYNITIVYFVQ